MHVQDQSVISGSVDRGTKLVGDMHRLPTCSLRASVCCIKRDKRADEANPVYDVRRTI